MCGASVLLLALSLIMQPERALLALRVRLGKCLVRVSQGLVVMGTNPFLQTHLIELLYLNR
jgi:hypothetical protein